MNSEITVKNARKRGLFSKQVAFSAQQNRILNIFFYTVLAGTFVAMLGIILYYVYAYAALSSGNHAFDWLLGIFSDFVYIMNVSLEESPYLIEDSSYPPIAIIVLYPFALICKGVFAQYANQVLTVDQLTSKVILQSDTFVMPLPKTKEEKTTFPTFQNIRKVRSPYHSTVHSSVQTK